MGEERKIVEGDTLWALTNGNQEAIQVTAELNNIADPNKIYAGDTITVVDKEFAKLAQSAGVSDIISKLGGKVGEAKHCSTDHMLNPNGGVGGSCTKTPRR